MIRNVIRLQNDMVLVFNKKGEQIPLLQGRCEEVKDIILEITSPKAVFAHGFTKHGEPKTVSRKKW